MRRRSIYEEADEETLNELPGSLNHRNNFPNLTPGEERHEFIEQLRSQIIQNGSIPGSMV